MPRTDAMTLAATRPATLARADDPADVDARFDTLVQSPLRAGLLRFLNARPDDTFDLEALMAAFGRLRMDVDNCLNELVDFGVVTRLGGDAPRYLAARPRGARAAELLAAFLERRASRRSCSRPCARACCGS